MAQAIGDPEQIEAFARELKNVSQQMQQSMSRLNGRFNQLGQTWRDSEHARFAKEFEQTVRVIQQFAKSADQQVPFLQRKAAKLRDYLQQR